MGLNVISETVGHSVSQFIDYSLILVIIIIVYQLFKMVTYSAAGSETPGEDQPNKIKEWLKKNKEKAKLTDEQKKREHLLGAAKGFMLRAEENIETAIEKLDDRNSNTIPETVRLLGRVKNNLRSAKRVFHSAMLPTTDPDLRNKLNDTGAGAQRMGEYTEIEVERKLPPNETVSDSDWNTQVSTAKNNLERLKAQCGAIINNIDQFVDQGSLSDYQFTP
jgi:hypothetical protein